MNINTAFPTIADKPRHQQYHVDNENSEATTQEINGNQKKFLTVIKSEKATFTHIDVHFTRGGERSAASLERVAKNKRKEYEAAHSYFLKLVKKLRSADEPRSEEAEVLCQIERLVHSLRFLPTGESRPNVVTFGVSYDGAFTDEAMSFLARLAAIKYP